MIEAELSVSSCQFLSVTVGDVGYGDRLIWRIPAARPALRRGKPLFDIENARGDEYASTHVTAQ
jgi:hypothetical protein